MAETISTPNRSQSWIAADRRVAQRHESRTQTSCFAPATGQTFSVAVLNVSRTGLGLLNETSLQAGESLVFDIPANGTLPALVLRGEVVRCVRYSPENWLVGYRLERPLSLRELRTLLTHWP